MRVALVTAGDIGRRTGGYLYHARVAGELAREGVRVAQVVASRDATPGGQRLAALDGDRLAEQVLAADVVVVDALAALVAAPWLDAWQARRPLIALVHELPSVASGDAAVDLRAAEARLLRADRVVAVSGHGRDILIAGGVAARRIVVAPPGADRLAAPSESEPAESGDGALHVLCVAQWIPRKGIETLLRAWLTLGRDDATLDLIGETDADPAYAARVRALVDAAPPGAVAVHDAVDDRELAAAYRRAALFVLPTRYEGYGMVFAEALLYGVPVVASAVGPVPDLVGPDAGLLTPPDDPTALAGAIARLLDDAGLRASMTVAARARGRELATWAETARAFRAALDAAIRERSE